MNTTRGYFVHSAQGQEGPYDLPMIMRKVRARKIDVSTPISLTDDPNPRPAGEFAEISFILQETLDLSSQQQKARLSAEKLTVRALTVGWKFVGMQPFACVYAGLVALLTYLVMMIASPLLPWTLTLLVGTFLFFVLQSVVMVTILRRYRGQYLDTLFLREQLAPSLIPLAAGALVTTAMGLIGLALLIVPGLFLFSVFAFVPFLIADRRMNLVRAMTASPALCFRHGMDSFGAVLGVTSLNLLSLLLIVPIPLMLPVTAVALADIYDELGH